MRKFLVLLLIFGIVSNSSALFEPVFVGGRYVALGSANITEVYDPYAMIYNPAGLSRIKGVSLGVSFSEPFGVPGMNLLNVNAAGNVVDIFQVGLSFASYGADISSIAGLRYTVIGVGLSTKFDLSVYLGVVDSISVGVSGKGQGMSLRGYEFDNSVNRDIWSFNLDGGLNISFMNEEFKASVVGYNIIPTKFRFFDNSQGSEVYSALKFGTSLYLVKPYMKVFASYALGLNPSSLSSLSVGTELSYLDTVFTRIGLDNNRITMGLGVRGPGFEVNFGVQNRDNLGWYYQIDVVGFVNLF